MFHAEDMPLDLSGGRIGRYVVDIEQSAWLGSLGTNGPVGHMIYQLAIQQARIPLEVDQSSTPYRISAFGASVHAKISHGVGVYRFSDDAEYIRTQKIAAEAVLVLMTDRYAEFGLSADHLRISLSEKAGEAIFSLADFGYGKPGLS